MTQRRYYNDVRVGDLFLDMEFKQYFLVLNRHGQRHSINLSLLSLHDGKIVSWSREYETHLSSGWIFLRRGHDLSNSKSCL